MYVRATKEVTVSETLLCDPPKTAGGVARLPRTAIAGRRLRAVELTSDVTIADLGPNMTSRAVAQDTWPTRARGRDPPGYLIPRRHPASRSP